MNYACYSTIRRRAGKQGLRIGVLLSLVILAGCYVYGPPPYPAPVYSYAPSTFERSWSAAQYAMQDVGVRVVSADRESGIIRGTRDAVDATVVVRTQADGRVRVEFSAKGPSAEDHNLANSIYQAYERRMGR
jgi:hypothetical protein